MTAVDMLEMPLIDSPSESPDGRYIVYLQRETDWEGAGLSFDLESKTTTIPAAKTLFTHIVIAAHISKRRLP